MKLSAITNYPGYYIDTDGNVYSCRGSKVYKKLHPARDGSGYLFVNLRRLGKTHKHKIHKLMALMFLRDYNTLQVNHINGVKNDNRLENLEMVTAKENIQHALQMGMMRHNKLSVSERMRKLEQAKLLQEEIGGSITDCLKQLT